VLVEPTLADAAAQDAIHPPAGPWRWRQEWRDVLFVHWRVTAESLGPHLPPGLALDLWEGEAYVSAVAFRLEVRMRGLPAFWPVSNLLELNLRTYVRCGNEPGIFFLSMHADNRLAMAIARCLTPLPYAAARFSIAPENRRVGPAALRPRRPTDCFGGPALASSLVPPYKCFRADTRSVELFCADFQPHGVSRESAANSLDAWLLERYRAFVRDRRGRLYRMAVEHPPWQWQDASLICSAPQLGESWGIDLEESYALSHYSDGLAANVRPFEIIRFD
jgi:uncharacterized protein YqjF (DUF2071 family)